eukprot:2469211-Rhodomonas_salina.2
MAEEDRPRPMSVQAEVAEHLACGRKKRKRVGGAYLDMYEHSVQSRLAAANATFVSTCCRVATVHRKSHSKLEALEEGLYHFDSLHVFLHCNLAWNPRSLCQRRTPSHTCMKAGAKLMTAQQVIKGGGLNNYDTAGH